MVNNLKSIAILVGFVTVSVVIVVLITSIPVMLLWNAIVPDLFGLPTITFWQAFGLSALLRLMLVGSTNRSHRDRRYLW